VRLGKSTRIPHWHFVELSDEFNFRHEAKFYLGVYKLCEIWCHSVSEDWAFLGCDIVLLGEQFLTTKCHIPEHMNHMWIVLGIESFCKYSDLRGKKWGKGCSITKPTSLTCCCWGIALWRSMVEHSTAIVNSLACQWGGYFTLRFLFFCQRAGARYNWSKCCIFQEPCYAVIEYSLWRG
jgi:hypothetical protein